MKHSGTWGPTVGQKVGFVRTCHEGSVDIVVGGPEASQVILYKKCASVEGTLRLKKAMGTGRGGINKEYQAAVKLQQSF